MTIKKLKKEMIAYTEKRQKEAYENQKGLTINASDNKYLPHLSKNMIMLQIIYGNWGTYRYIKLTKHTELSIIDELISEFLESIEVSNDN